MHEEDGRIISNFVAQAIRGEALTVYGDGRQTRSFCYVADMVRALMALDGEWGQTWSGRSIWAIPTSCR